MFIARLRHSFERHATRQAVQFARRAYTFAELESAAERIAAILQEAGVEPGDRVGLSIESKEIFLLSYLGSLWAGAVPLPLNPAFKPRELVYFLRDSEAQALVCDDAGRSASDLVRSGSPIRAVLSSAEIVTRQAPARYRMPNATPDDPVLMLYSSGTTGEPKGVVHSQRNLAAAVESLAAEWSFTPDDILTNALPLFHIHGLSFATNLSLLAGSCMMVADTFHPTRTLELVDESTVFMAVPTYYYSLLKRPEFRDHAARWHRLRLLTCGSAPIRPELLPELESIVRRPIINRYGMTECHVLTSLPMTGPWPHGSVGRPIAGVEVMVRDEAGQSCGPGVVGRVFARGPNLFREYFRRPEATAEAFRTGWFDTGDLAQWDSRGFLTLVGRSSDLIIVAGFNVYPAVVERVIGECPGVGEVAVVGLADERRGERVAAFIVPTDPTLNAKTVRAFCLERMVDYQCPTQIEFVASLPRNAMGKVLKRELQSSGAAGSACPSLS